MTEQTSKILGEIPGLQILNQKESQQAVDVYVDLKSPHAYLAIRPSLELARDFKVFVNFLPYTLSYVTLGVSSEVTDEMKRKPANAASDRKARMYYAAAREYAKIQGLPFKSPYRLLDSSMANIALLFAKRQSLEIPFLLKIYTSGWGSGWRDYELESVEASREVLLECGADMTGFEQYISKDGAGLPELQKYALQAEESGIAGVPHYVLKDDEKHKGLSLFGREHLALIRSRLSERGLARDSSVEAAFSHTWPN